MQPQHFPLALHACMHRVSSPRCNSKHQDRPVFQRETGVLKIERNSQKRRESNGTAAQLDARKNVPISRYK